MNAKTEEDFTPLMGAAARTNDPKVIEELIAAGAELEVGGKEGCTPLMQASAHNKNPEIIKTLVGAGADGKMRLISGKTAFDHAENNPSIEGSEAYWLLNEIRF